MNVAERVKGERKSKRKESEAKGGKKERQAFAMDPRMSPQSNPIPPNSQGFPDSREGRLAMENFYHHTTPY
jgi:hypothetical protein